MRRPALPSPEAAALAVARDVNRLVHVARVLGEAPWFDAGWQCSVFCTPAEGLPEYGCLQLFKAGWHNAGHQGVHIETWLGAPERATRQVPVVLHILHVDTFPGTTHKRAALSKPLLEQAGAQMAGWPGYTVSRSTAKPLTGHFAFTDETLTDVLATEFTRLSQLGPVIDGILARF